MLDIESNNKMKETRGALEMVDLPIMAGPVKCSLSNASRSAWSWAVSTGPIRGRRTLMPPSWTARQEPDPNNLHNY